VTPARYAEGMTVAQYLTYVGTPENLEREAGWLLGPRRVDFSAPLRRLYEGFHLNHAQVAAVRWLAEAGGLELRIFTRDGRTVRARGARSRRRVSGVIGVDGGSWRLRLRRRRLR
jgi:hypothetical protein